MVTRIQGVAHWLHGHGVPVLPKLLKACLFLGFNCVMPPECEIGPGTRFWHHALGVVIHPSTRIGRDCNIYNHVVIGGGHDSPDGPPISITIGDRVTIGAGAKVLCKGATLRVGDNSAIGANAVVLGDVPPNTVVAGVPAKVVGVRSAPEARASTPPAPATDSVK